MALIPVCDNCGEREDVLQYTIEVEGRKARVDLCKTHAEPLVEVMDLVEASAPAKPAAKRTRRRPAVKSMAEVEALKS